MSNDPYAAPTANLDNFTDSPVIPTKIMSAKGRLSVASYWAQAFLLTLASSGIYIVLGLIGVAVGKLPIESFASLESIEFSSPILAVLGILAVIVYLTTIVISIFMIIKRAHDRNHNGWWLLGLFVVFSITALVVPFAIFIPMLGLFYVLFFPGQKTDNLFGGRRATKNWEKVLCIVFLVLIVVAFVAALIFGSDLMMDAS